MATAHNTSNHDIAVTLGRMDAKLDAQTQSSARQEGQLKELDHKLTTRLNNHDERLRDLEIANPTAIGTTVKSHEQRLQELEKKGVKYAVATSAVGSIGMALLLEWAKQKLGG